MEFETQLDTDEFKDLLRARVLLFLSVDIEDSTALKRKLTWFGTVAGFLTGFTQQFHAKLGKKDKACKPPKLWKAMGDELVFAAELNHTEDLRKYVVGFLETVHENNRDKKPGTPKLKASAWIAEFPHKNAIMPLTKNGGPERAYDYIGPQMDVGFRLARFATTRRFTVSLELAYLALLSNSGLSFYWDGRHPIKGLIDKPGYPILWLDIDISGKMAKDESGFGRGYADKKTLLDDCRHHEQRLRAQVRLPTISHGNKVRPKNYPSNEKRKTRSRYQAVITVTETESASVSVTKVQLPDAKKLAQEFLKARRSKQPKKRAR